jgi:hypothetical protein
MTAEIKSKLEKNHDGKSKNKTQKLDSTEDKFKDADEDFEEIESPGLHHNLERLHEDIGGVKSTAVNIIPIALDDHIKRSKAAINAMEKLFENLSSESETGVLLQVINDSTSSNIHDFQKISSMIDELNRDRRPDTIILNSLFLYLFSCYETFSGSLLTELYKLNPEVFISDKQVSLREVIKYDSINELQNKLLEEDIESFRRDSYDAQFKFLEAKFNIQTLRKFENWPLFVEAGQRRNLFTHCDGIVSSQYLRNCRVAGVKLGSDLSEGDKLDLDVKYLTDTCDLLMEVATKLTHTVWRKVAPDDIENADTCLTALTYKCLEVQHWNQAKLYSTFHFEQKRHHSQTTKYISCINLAIALHWLDDKEGLDKCLQKLEWEIVTNDFQIARYVLLAEFDSAVDSIRRMGKEGNLISKSSYSHWPLFSVHDFKYSSEFKAIYKEIYEEDFHIDFDYDIDKTSLPEELVQV